MAEKYKASKYNHFVPTNNDKILAFNALSCGLGQMDKENYEVYQKIASGDITDYSQVPQDLFEKLKQGKFLILQAKDEIQEIKAKHYMARFGNLGLALTVIPTLKCNFACDYCYEPGNSNIRRDSKRKVMSQEIQDGLVKMIESRLPQGTILGVTWYGGEPLLGLEIIESLTKKLKKVCEEKKAKYSANIITNGYLLTPQVVNKLVELGIKTCQVTIDGPKEIHNRRRPLVGGDPTYQTIVHNLERIPESISFYTVIRVNVDDRNREYITRLLEDLKGHNLHSRKNMNVYFSRVVASTDSCKDIGEHCIVAREFAIEELKLYKEAVDFGFKVRHYPMALIANCSAVKPNSFVVEPNGTLQACWNTVGREEMKVGSIEDSSVKFNDRYYRWLSWSPFEKKGCENCSVLPLCMGSCPYTSIYKSEMLSKDKNNCVIWKYNLKEMMRFYVEAKKSGLFIPPKREVEKDDAEKPEQNSVRIEPISKRQALEKQICRAKIIKERG